MCSPTLHRPSFHTCLRSAARLAAHVLAGPCAAAMDVDSLSVQLEELRAANGGRLPGCKKLAAACGISQREAKELLQQLKLEQDLEKELADGESATKCARKRKACEAVDAADTLPDRQPEDLDTQQDEVADVEVDSEAEALAAEADLEAGAHEAARVVAARKAADAQLALEDSASQEAAARSKICRAQIEKVFCLSFVSRSEACPACSRGLSLLRFTAALRFACRSLQTLARGQQMLLAQMEPEAAKAFNGMDPDELEAAAKMSLVCDLGGRSHAPVCF